MQLQSVNQQQHQLAQIVQASVEVGADNSIALGSYASVPTNYYNSVALGTSATVTAANQIMLGTSNKTVKIPGTLDAANATFAGTVTADGLTVGANDSILFGTANTTGIYRTNSGNDLTMQHWGNLSMLIDSDNNDANSRQFLIGRNSQDASTALKIALFSENGDISFYEDTGSVQKFFWDASTERLGIGTSLPSRQIHLASSVPSLRLEDTDVSGLYGEIVQLATGDLSFRTDHGNVQASSSMSFSVDGSERMRIDSSGNVGIGITSPEGITSGITTLSISDLGSKTTGDKNGVLAFKTNDASYTGTYSDGVTGEIYSISESATGAAYGLGFLTGTTNSTDRAERMRIDSSGNLLVGRTDVGFNSESIVLRERGEAYITSDGRAPLLVNRLTSDGDIVSFRKDNTVVGSIGSSASQMYIGYSDTGIRFTATADDIRPWNPSTGVIRDGAIDLGDSAGRFKDLYLSGGVYLGGTGSANKLSDYEEGTFTASMVPSTSGTITLNSGVLKLAYTKIGRKVHIQGLLETTSKSSPVGRVEIRNLPFTAVDGEQYTGRCGAGMRISNVEGTGLGIGDVYSWYILEGGTTINVDIDASTVHPSSYSQFYISVTYITS
jgi:hypothetical protein